MEIFKKVFKSEIEKYAEEVLVRLLGSLRNQIEILRIFEEILPNWLRKLYAEEIRSAERLLRNGKENSVVGAFHRVGFISDETYTFFQVAMETGNLKDLLAKKQETDKKAEEKKRQIIGSLVYFGILYGASAVLIYVMGVKLYSQLKTVIPFPQDKIEVQFFNWLSSSMFNYIALVLTIPVLLIIAYIFRTRLPLIKDIYYAYQKFILFQYLALNLQSGFTLLESLKRYKGIFNPQIEAIIKKLQKGLNPKQAFLEEFRDYLSPFEKAKIQASFSSSNIEQLAKGFENIAEEASFDYDKNLAKLKMILTYVGYGIAILAIYLSATMYADQYSAVSAFWHH